jgi:ABC-type dipeptide/oligopeptide/nickel transport system ATPase component
VSGANEMVVQVTDLNVSFKTAIGTVKVVENVSFSLSRGECLAVVGLSLIHI